MTTDTPNREQIAARHTPSFEGSEVVTPADPESVVWKYELAPGFIEVPMPRGAKLLTVAAQGDGIFVWAFVSLANQSLTERRRFLTVGTGHRWPTRAFGPFVGTAFLDGLVFHVFEGGSE